MTQEAKQGTTFLFRNKTNGGKKRDPITLPVVYPDADKLASIYNEGGKPLQKVLGIIAAAMNDVIQAELRDNPSYTAENFPATNLTWEYFVSIPEAERAIRGIAKEVWKGFSDSFKATMPTITGRTAEQISKASKLLIDQRCSEVRTNKPVLEKLQQYLAMYAQSPEAEQYVEAIAVLDAKISNYLTADQTNLLDSF